MNRTPSYDRYVMVGNSRLTGRDLQILDTLTHRVRVLAVRQVAQTWWADAKNATQSAQRRLRSLSDGGHVHLTRILSQPVAPLERPLLTWRAPDPIPDFAPVVSLLRRRWHAPVTPTAVVLATKALAASLGGHAQPPRLSEGTHDLHVAEVFLRLLRASPARAQKWVPEAKLAAGGTRSARVPDALLALPGRPLVIEVGGTSYDKDKLRAFHGFCEAKGYDYELW